jgi:hypothetical protein
METFIPAEDVIARIKYHPDITPKEKEKFKEQLKGLYMTDKRKEQIFKPITKNQNRNENTNAIFKR